MEIAEFLLARIAEDEAAASQVHENDCDSHGWLGPPCDCAWPARVVAEGEAKRRIVENERNARQAMGAAPLEQLLSAQDGPTSAYWRGQDHVLRLLAMPYADHPDYDSEWKP